MRCRFKVAMLLKMMKLPSILKTPKHRTFEFKPRYYDADK